MTKFEVERLEAAFKYLNDRLLDNYSEILEGDNPDRIKTVQNKISRRMDGYDEVKRVLETFGFFEESDAKDEEKLFNDPECNHTFHFSVNCKMFKEVYTEQGKTAEQAEHYLRSHLAFEYCNSLSPEDFEIKLLAKIR